MFSVLITVTDPSEVHLFKTWIQQDFSSRWKIFSLVNISFKAFNCFFFVFVLQEPQIFKLS